MRRSLPILLLLSALAAGACEPVVLGVAAPMIFRSEKVNVMNASYAAADQLVVQSQKYFAIETPLVVEDLQELVNANKKNPVTSPGLGRVLTDQIRARFQQLGYNVIDPLGYGASAGGAGVVSGTYRIVNGSMLVRLRMNERATNRLLAMYDYSLPVTYDIKKLRPAEANTFPSISGEAFEDAFN